MGEETNQNIDVTSEVKKDSDDFGMDGHSHSYFTLKELIDWQEKHKQVKYRGMISPEAQKNLDEKGILPDGWCRATNEIGFEWREWVENCNILEDLISGLKKRADELNIIYDFLWEEESYNEAYEKSNGIRIVFWFDN